MSTTYAQKQAPAQKTEISKTATVHDFSTQNKVLQHKSEMINKTIQCAKNRPNFSYKNKKAYRHAVDKYHKKIDPLQMIDLCHRVSWHEISLLRGIPWSCVKDKIKALTIPSRDYGCMRKNNKDYYRMIKKIAKSKPKKYIDDEVLKLLNNSPINLRPGSARTNRSIGAGFDPCLKVSRGRSRARQTSRSRSLTPISKRMAETFGFSFQQSSDLDNPIAKSTYEEMVTQ